MCIRHTLHMLFITMSRGEEMVFDDDDWDDDDEDWDDDDDLDDDDF